MKKSCARLRFQTQTWRPVSYLEPRTMPELWAMARRRLWRMSLASASRTRKRNSRNTGRWSSWGIGSWQGSPHRYRRVTGFDPRKLLLRRYRCWAQRQRHWTKWEQVRAERRSSWLGAQRKASGTKGDLQSSALCNFFPTEGVYFKNIGKTKNIYKKYFVCICIYVKDLNCTHESE